MSLQAPFDGAEDHRRQPCATCGQDEEARDKAWHYIVADVPDLLPPFP